MIKEGGDKGAGGERGEKAMQYGERKGVEGVKGGRKEDCR